MAPELPLVYCLVAFLILLCPLQGIAWEPGCDCNAVVEQQLSRTGLTVQIALALHLPATGGPCSSKPHRAARKIRIVTPWSIRR